MFGGIAHNYKSYIQYSCQVQFLPYLKMQQKLFGGQVPPEPTVGAYSAPPAPLLGFEGQGRVMEGRERMERGGGEMVKEE